MSNKLRALTESCLVLLALLALWWLASHSQWVSKVFLPTPEATAASLAEGLQQGDLWAYTGATLGRMLLGWGLACALGIALLSVRRGAWITGLFLAVETVAVVVLIVVGAGRPARGFEAAVLHPMAPDAAGHLVPVALGVMALGAISAVYATVGGNQAIYFGEELA